jgi:predicted nucleotidyltransferase
MGKKEIKNKILKNGDIFKKYQVKNLAIFGSFVKNQQRKNSDLDFLVEFDNATFDNYMGLWKELKRLFHRKIDLINKSALKEKIKPHILKSAEWLKTTK